MHRILKERESNGPFTSFENLNNRIYIPLDQILILIRIGALRDLNEPRKSLLWKAHLFHNKTKDKTPETLLFPRERKEYHLPNLEDNDSEQAFEQMELLDFPLCNPFLLLKTPPPIHVLAKTIAQHVGKQITCFGYLVSLKQSRTLQGDYMFFGNFIDMEGEIIDSVHFPEVARKFPYHGKGIYLIKGWVSEEFGHYSIIANTLLKQTMIEDARYSENEPLKT